MVEEFLAFTEWQRVEDGSHEALRNVEIRDTLFARIGAERILRREVVPRAADGAGGVDGLGPRVGKQGIQAVGETLRELGAEGVVTARRVRKEILNSGSPTFRIGQALHRR